jgi:hypothetical protein
MAFDAAVVSFLEQALRFQRRNGEKAESEASVMENDINDGVILAARLLLAALFLIFGWSSPVSCTAQGEMMINRIV